MHCRKQERAQNHTFPGPLQKRCLPKLCGSSGYLESVASIMERTKDAVLFRGAIRCVVLRMIAWTAGNGSTSKITSTKAFRLLEGVRRASPPYQVGS